MNIPKIDGIYNPRFYHKTQLYQIVKDNLDEFLKVYPVKFAKDYGELRPEVEKSFRSFLECGNPEDGFAIYECPHCHLNLIIPYSCKNYICPSCSEKRTLDWGAWLIGEILYNIPHYFITFTMPQSIRCHFFTNRWLIPYLERSIADILMYYMAENSEKKGAIPGIIIVPQTFGERLNANIHFHCLVTTATVDMATGGCYSTRLPEFYQLRQVWKNKILKLLLNMKIITHKEYVKIYST